MRVRSHAIARLKRSWGVRLIARLNFGWLNVSNCQKIRVKSRPKWSSCDIRNTHFVREFDDKYWLKLFTSEWRHRLGRFRYVSRAFMNEFPSLLRPDLAEDERGNLRRVFPRNLWPRDIINFYYFIPGRLIRDHFVIQVEPSGQFFWFRKRNLNPRFVRFTMFCPCSKKFNKDPGIKILQTTF